MNTEIFYIKRHKIKKYKSTFFDCVSKAIYTNITFNVEKIIEKNIIEDIKEVIKLENIIQGKYYKNFN